MLNGDCWSRCQACLRDSSSWGQSKTKTAVGANTAAGGDFSVASTETSDVFKKISDVFGKISNVFGKISDVFWKNSNVFSGCSVILVHKWERTGNEGLSAAIHNTKSKGCSSEVLEESAFSTEEASGR